MSYTPPINYNFPSEDEADEYTYQLFNDVLDIDPDPSPYDAFHYRTLKIETEDGGCIEIRPDHSISGGYRSYSKYMNLDTLNGTVGVIRNDEDALYYVIINRG